MLLAGGHTMQMRDVQCGVGDHTVVRAFTGERALRCERGKVPTAWSLGVCCYRINKGGHLIVPSYPIAGSAGQPLETESSVHEVAAGRAPSSHTSLWGRKAEGHSVSWLGRSDLQCPQYW